MLRIFALLFALSISPSFAADNMFPTPGNALAPGSVNMCLNGSGQAVACPAGGSGTYSAAATALTGNAQGTTGAVVGTLAAAAGKTTYICGFNVSALGGTAVISPVTVAGLVGSSQVYQASSSATGTFLSQTFSPCIPASAANTAITVTTTADGTATAVDVNSWGFRQ